MRDNKGFRPLFTPPLSPRLKKRKEVFCKDIYLWYN